MKPPSFLKNLFWIRIPDMEKVSGTVLTWGGCGFSHPARLSFVLLLLYLIMPLCTDMLYITLPVEEGPYHFTMFSLKN
jgi:hypothetical protein